MLLKGIQILDLSRVLAGPFATMYLSELGAEVIKVEPPEGDETRRYTPIINGVSTYFYSINRGKKSISINLKHSEGRKILYSLVERSNVLIHNYRDDTAEKLGVDYKKIVEVNPDIVYTVIRGYDVNSSMKNYPAYDIVIQGLSGIMMATGREGEEPTRVGFALADIFAGLYTASTILATLQGDVERPVKIEINLLDSLIYSMSYLIYSYLLAGVEPGRYGSAHPSIVPYQAFRCRDGKWIIVAAANNRLFNRLCKALKLEWLTNDERFVSNDKRVENREALVKLLREKFLEQDSDRWLEILRSYEVPCAPVNRISDIVRHRYMDESGLIGEISDPRLGNVKYVRPPIRINGSRPYTQKYPPSHSEDTVEILRDLGYSVEEIKSLLESGIVK